MKLADQITQIPKWKRFLICHLNRKQWKLARAYNTVGVDLLHGSNWELGDAIRNRGDVLWAELYGIDAPEVKDEMWAKRAQQAEFELDWNAARCKQLEAYVKLLEKTALSLGKLRRQRTLPLS